MKQDGIYFDKSKNIHESTGSASRGAARSRWLWVSLGLIGGICFAGCTPGTLGDANPPNKPTGPVDPDQQNIDPDITAYGSQNSAGRAPDPDCTAAPNVSDKTVTNIALDKRASQSGRGWAKAASKAVDGNPDPSWGGDAATMTGMDVEEGDLAWWQVDLGGLHRVDAVKIFPADYGKTAPSELSDFDVVLLRPSRQKDAETGAWVDVVVERFSFDGTLDSQRRFEVSGDFVSTVRIERRKPNQHLALAEVEVEGYLTAGLCMLQSSTTCKGKGVCYEAEAQVQGSAGDGRTAVTCPSGGSVEFVDVFARWQGNHTLTLGYSTPGDDAVTATVKVVLGTVDVDPNPPEDTKDFEAEVTLPGSGGASTESMHSFRVHLDRGFNRIAISACGGEVSIDWFSVFEGKIPPPVAVPKESALTNAAGTEEATRTAPNLVQRTERFEFPGHIAPAVPTSVRSSGPCWGGCDNGPYPMYTASFNDTLLVAWAATDPNDATRQYGNVATFTVDANGDFTFVRNVSFDGLCHSIYGIEASDDGQVIGLMCRDHKGVWQPLADAQLLLLEQEKQSPDCGGAAAWRASCFPIGAYSAIDAALYLFEFDGGVVDATPERKVYINHAVGGWEYGQLELFLNSAGTMYYVHQKATAGPTITNRHEGLTSYGIRRPTADNPRFDFVRPAPIGWGCGRGHVEQNRGAYNESANRWGMFCRLDSCDAYAAFEKGCVSLNFVETVTEGDPAQPERFTRDGHEVVMDFARPGGFWDRHGGVSTILSMGADGWLMLANGPRDPGAAEQPSGVGLLRAPLGMDALRASGSPIGGDGRVQYPWKWLALAPSADSEATTRYGLAEMAYLGTQGENSQHLLVGWSPSASKKGLTDEYYVSVMDRDGNLVDSPMTLESAGWGEGNLWRTMPNSGCVVFPHAWVGDGPGTPYVGHEQEPVSDYPKTMRLTSICPVN